jgi:hypothetical protein
MRLAPAAVILAFAACPVAAQQPGSLPPPVPRPAEPGAAANDAAPARQPGFAERAGAALDRAMGDTGQAIERAAESTAPALGRALRWTGERLQGAGEWTARQGERLTGPSAAPAPPPPPAPAPPAGAGAPR